MTTGGTYLLIETDTKSVQHEETFDKSFEEYLSSPEHHDRSLAKSSNYVVNRNNVEEDSLCRDPSDAIKNESFDEHLPSLEGQDRSLALNKYSDNYDVDGKSKEDDSLYFEPSDVIESDDNDDTSDVKINQEPILRSCDVTARVQKAHDELTLHWINICTETRDDLKQIGIQLMNANISSAKIDRTQCGWISDNENQQKIVRVLENCIKHLRDTTDIDMFKCISDPDGLETPDALLFRTADSLEKDFAFLDTVIKRWKMIRIEMNNRDVAMSRRSISGLCKDYANQFGDDCKFVSQTMIGLSSSRNADGETYYKQPRIPDISEVKRSPDNGIEGMKELFLVPKPPSASKPKNVNFRRNIKIVQPHSNPVVEPTKPQRKPKEGNLNELSRCSWPLGHHNEHLYLGSDPRMGKNQDKFLTNKPSKIPVNTVFILREQNKCTASKVPKKNWPIGFHNVRKFLGFDPRRRGYNADKIDGGKTRIPIGTAYIIRKIINDHYLKRKLSSNQFLKRKEFTPLPKCTKSHMSADNRNCLHKKERKPKLNGEYKRITADTKELCETVNRDTSSIRLPAIHRPRKAEASRLYQRNSNTKQNSMSEISLPKIKGAYTYTGESSLSRHSFDGPSQRRKGMQRTRW